MSRKHQKPSRPPKKKPVEITVITPSLPQRSAMLAEACASVAAQTLQPKRHLVAVDYGYQGPGRMLNQLTEAADTEWVSILADDDLYDPDHLETLAAETGNGSIILSWCRFDGLDREQYRGEFDPRRLLARLDSGMRGIFMFRKNVWNMLGGFHEGPMEDWDFLVRAVQAGIRFAPVHRETWTYRWHDVGGGNLSNAITKLANGETPDELYHLAKHV